jgi:DNA repair protein RecO (recombination protein O)
MAIQKTDAIVLKTMPFRSSSLIITFFTRSFGKLRGLAKGVRQENQTRPALFELFTGLEIIFYEKTRSELHLVSEASILESYEGLHAGLEEIAYAGYFAELVEELCEVHDPHERIYELLDFCYRYLSSVPGQRLAHLFEIKLFAEIGWLPYLNACLKCGDAHLESGFFSARQGTLLCPRCVSSVPDARPITAETLAALRYYTRHSLEESLKLGLTRQTEEELDFHLQRFLTDRHTKPIKSRIFLQKIKPALR